MPKKVGNYQIPFINGRMLEYKGWDTSKIEWRDNWTFTARLKLNGHWRGRSSARVGVKNEANGERYSMGFGAFYDAVAGGTCKDGYIEGTWTFRKQGSNYILIPVPADVARP